jgi:RHS repeat-associated protein
MKSKFFNRLVVFATAFLFAFSSSSAADPENQVCTEECFYNPVTGGYEWIIKCLPVDPPNPCPGNGSGGNGSGSGGNGSGGGGGAGGHIPKGLQQKLCPSCGDGGGQGEKEEGEGEECCEEGGMPHWWVGEPRINLFVHDKPFWYRASRGPEIAFKLLFKNEPGTNSAIDTRQTSVFGVGTNWHTPWRSYVQKSPNGSDRYYLFSGDGSAVEHLAISEPDRHTAAVYSFDGTNHYFSYNHGVRKVFSPTLSNATTVTLWFLSRIEYPQGVTNRFEYIVTNGAVRLAKVIDVDNRETTFAYTNSGYYSHLISKVVGPYGQAASLTYSNGQLTSIKDMTNLVSTLEYTETRLSKLSTPYGTNRFDYYSGTGWNGLRVTEHEVRKHFFLFGDGPTDLFPGAGADYESLKNYLSAASITETLDNTNLHLRNSYFWGPRQYANLSSTIRAKLDDATFQITDLNTNEFNKGRTRHWLAVEINQSTNRPIGTTLAMERLPSPNADGSTEGLIVWYDHPNKDDPALEGNPKGATLKAWKLSGANWQVIKYERAINNRITKEKFNYGEPSEPKWKTNTYTLNGVDITQVSGAGPENFTRSYNGFHQVLNHYNALNELTVYEYDHLQRLTNVTHPNGLMTSSTYDTNGNVATVIDRSASQAFRTNSYTWTNGLVHTHTDERGLTTTYVYDVFNRITKQFYPDGTGITNLYNKLDLIQTTDRLGYTSGFEYNNFREVLRHTNANQKVTSYEYCDCGSLSSITNALNDVTSFTYDNAGRQTRVTYPGNTYVDYFYDTAHRLVRTADSAGVNVTNYYTLDGKAFTASNAFGRIFYEREGDYALREIQEANQTIQLTCKTNLFIDENGIINRVVYDLLERPVETIKDIGATRRTFHFTTDPGGVLYSVTLNDASNYTTDFGESGTYTYTYHSADNTADLTLDPAAPDDLEPRAYTLYFDTSTYLVEAGGGIIEVGSFTHTGEYRGIVQHRSQYTPGVAGPAAEYHEAVESFISMTPPSNSPTRLDARIEYAYDLFGRKTNEVHVDLANTALLTNRFTYSPAGDLLTLSDGKNQTTTWNYDQDGHVTHKVDHMGADMFRYAYDANDRLTNRWTPAKLNTSYGYDAVGNLTSVDYNTSTDITLSYDAANRLTNMVDAAGSTRYSYTGFGAIASEDGPWPDDTVSYTYDNGRRRSGLSVQAPSASGWSQSYAYDAANRLSTISSPAGNFSYGYHPGFSGPSPSSLLRQISLPNTSAITNRYDGNGRMLGTWLRNSAGTILNKHEYLLNSLDQRTQMTRADGSYVGYSYDDLAQLKTALGKESGGITNRLHEQFTYAYDAAGNLTTRVQNTLTNAFTFNSLNQLTGGSRTGSATAAGTVSSNATSVTVALNGGTAVNALRYADHTFVRTNLTLVNGTNTFTAAAQDALGRVDTNTVTAYLPASATYIYDSNGNLTYDGRKSFEWDDENRLLRLTATNTWKSEFVYDCKKRRRVRREFTWQNSAWVLTNEIRYVYDGNLVIQERNQFNVPAVSYTRGLDLSGTREGAGGIGGLRGRTDHFTLNSELSSAYYQSDGSGNVTTLIDANQNIVARYTYEPFGRVLSISGPLAAANSYRFSSKEAHDPSGLIYYLYRYYDANSQRWINRDSLQELGGLNFYTYVVADPMNAADPFGEQAVGTNLPPLLSSPRNPQLPFFSTPWGTSPTATGPRSGGGIMGGAQPDAFPSGLAAPNAVPCYDIGKSTTPQAKGSQVKDCPCSGPNTTVTCYEWKECLFSGFGWAKARGGGMHVVGYWQTKSDCPCPEYSTF